MPQPDGSKLFYAARANDTALVNKLLKQGAELEWRDPEGCTPLSIACFYGSYEAAEALCAHGAELDARDSSQMTPLMHAAYMGHTKICEMLLALGADPSLKDKRGKTALDQQKQQVRFVFARQAGGHPQVALYANGPDQAATHNIPKGTRLEVLREDHRRDGDWLQIVADGTGLKGWVKKANVVDRLDGGGGGGGGSSSGKYSGYTYGSSGGGSGGCKVPGCKEAHSKHYCKVCGDNDSDHFAKDCPSKAGSGGGGGSSSKMYIDAQPDRHL